MKSENDSKKVYFIGAGPGKPDLITVRGRRVLQNADVIIYDYLVNEDILEYAPQECETLCTSDYGKRSNTVDAGEAQNKVNKIIVAKAKNGKKVVRLKNGDSAFFSRISEEMNTLVKNGIEFEIIPGVTSASAVSAYTGIPLTDRQFSSSVVFVTGRESVYKKYSSINWKSVGSSGTIVLYMSVGNIANIVKRLEKAGASRDMCAVEVANVSSIFQKVIRGKVENIATLVQKNKLQPPAVIIIGRTPELEAKYNWFRKSRKILFTGLSQERYFLTGTYFHIPMIDIKPLNNYKELDIRIRNIKKYNWIVFTSRYGVKYFFYRLYKNKLDSRALSHMKIAVIGTSTKDRLLKYGIKADLKPKLESSKGLINMFGRIDMTNQRILMPRSDIADKGLTEKLSSLGAEVDSVYAYRNVVPEDLPDLDISYFDEIMFTSPSTVRNFKKRYSSIPKKVKVTSIGEVTKKELNKQKIGGSLCLSYHKT